MTVVAIDGPAGAGKSTVARALARALGWLHLDTGAMYRAVALAALDSGVDAMDEVELAELARRLDIEATPDAVLVDGVDVSARIRSAEVTDTVARVAAHARVRSVLAARQQAVARAADVVMEGRDIGATVAPGAALKVYLTASLKARARRRALELGSGDAATVDAEAAALAARDRADSSRRASPLAAAPDAVVVDTTDLTVEDVVGRVLAELRARTDG